MVGGRTLRFVYLVYPNFVSSCGRPLCVLGGGLVPHTVSPPTYTDTNNIVERRRGERKRKPRGAVRRPCSALLGGNAGGSIQVAGLSGRSALGASAMAARAAMRTVRGAWLYRVEAGDKNLDLRGSYDGTSICGAC